MPIPNEIKFQHKGTRRVDEFTEPELVSENDVIVLNNMVLDIEGGKAVKRGGLKKFNNNAAASSFASLHDVVDENGNNYLIGAAGTNFIKSLKGTGAWSNIKTGLTNEAKTRIATYDGKFFVANGKDEMFVTDIHTDQWDFNVDKPDVGSVTTADASGGSLEADARYRWIIVYVTDKGEVSNVSMPIGHSLNGDDGNSTDATNKKITLSNLPVSSDSRVTSRRIYRTEGDGITFYLLKGIDNTVTSYLDDRADTKLSTADTISFVDEILTAEYLTIHKDRLVIANVTKNKKNYVTTKPAQLPVILVTANNGAPGMLDGIYKYKISFLKDNDEESELTKEISVELDKNVYAWTNYESKITLTDIVQPFLGASDDFDSSIIQIRIYRTKAGGSIYYWVKDLQPSSTSYATADNTPDSSLTNEAYPKSGAGATDTVNLFSHLMFSELGQPTSMKTLNSFPIFPNDGDVITGLINQADGVLIWKTNSICKIFTSGSPRNWSVQKLVQLLGCDDPDSIAVAGSRIYFRNKSHVYRYPDRLKLPLSLSKKYTIEALPRTYDAIYMQSRQWYVMACGDMILVYDEKYEGQDGRGAWYEFNDGTISSGYGQFYSTRYGIHL